MDPGSGEATVVDPATAKVLATVPVGGSLEFATADGHGRMYVNVEDKNEVAVLDTKARKTVSRFPLAGCDGPTGIALTRPPRPSCLRSRGLNLWAKSNYIELWVHRAHGLPNAERGKRA